jgi:hypothetical protein
LQVDEKMERNIMNKELKTEINRAAHLMAQQQYAAYRIQLLTECKRMLGERRSLSEVLEWITQAAIKAPTNTA